MKIYIITKEETNGYDFDIANDFDESEAEKVVASGHVDAMIAVATYVLQSCPRNEEGLFHSEQSIIDAVYEALENKVYETDSSATVESLIDDDI